MGCVFGGAAMYIWALGILAAGQSSTMTGTYAGQFAMEGFLNLQWARWRRVLVTRLIAIIPTFFVAFYSRIEDLTGMNDTLNAVMALQLPFAVLPTIAFTSSVAIMGEFVNGLANKVVSVLLCVVVIGINIFFVVQKVENLNWGWKSMSSEFLRPFLSPYQFYLNQLPTFITFSICCSNFRHFIFIIQCLSCYPCGSLHGQSTASQLSGILILIFTFQMIKCNFQKKTIIFLHFISSSKDMFYHRKTHSIMRLRITPIQGMERPSSKFFDFGFVN